ncbi:hypothetical protein [Alteraurantiacibacter aestuarii]|uniref:hypothetical protein n=1 Tax=Alteraurantiacibacter aestuarii TaxID=650004 RepID=UPI0031CFAADB
MKFAKLFIAAAALAAAPVVVHAQAAEVDLSVGATVIGNDGNAVGSIISNDGTTVVIDTGMHQVPLGADSFGQGETGPTINITKTALDEMVSAQLAEASAALEAALTVGAPVITYDAQELGMIDEIDGSNVIVKAADEQLVTLPLDMLALDANGQIMALANLADIQAALEAQAGG